MNERDELERPEQAAWSAYLDDLPHATTKGERYAFDAGFKAGESREREQTLALLAVAEVTGEWVALIDEARVLADLGPLPITMEMRSNDLLTRVRDALASYEAAHALQVAHEEVKG